MHRIDSGYRLLLLRLILAGAAASIFPPPAVADEPATAETDVAVGVGQAERRTLRAYVTAYGAVEAEPAEGGRPPASALVASPSTGLVTEARCEEGQKVKRGQVLFTLEHRLADVQVEKAQTALALAEKNLERKQALARTDNVSQKLLYEAEQQVRTASEDLALARVQRALLQIEAPLNGTVVRIQVRPGEAVSGNAAVAELVDLDRLVVNAAVPGPEAPRVRLGQPVRLAVTTEDTATGGVEPAPVKGTVSFIGLQVDPRTATVPVRIALPAGSGLRPGQFVQARIAVEERPDRLAVPVESVVTREGESAIFVVDGDRATPRRVRLGLKEGDFVEVTGDGVQAGTAIVTTGAFGLPGQTRIHPLPR
jgi:membrane fusion protein (multidrug efflux system)